MDLSNLDPAFRWFASMYKQAESTMVMAIDTLRKKGGRLSDYVLVVADTSDRATQLLCRDMGKAVDAKKGNTGVVTLVPNADVSRALRISRVDEYADLVDSPLAEGMMRLLFAARGKVFCTDVPAFPPLPPTGSA